MKELGAVIVVAGLVAVAGVWLPQRVEAQMSEPPTRVPLDQLPTLDRDVTHLRALMEEGNKYVKEGRPICEGVRISLEALVKRQGVDVDFETGEIVRLLAK